MKNLEKIQNNNATSSSVFSVEECKEHLAKFELTDEKIIEIQNYLTGIIDQSISLYLEDFK